MRFVLGLLIAAATLLSARAADNPDDATGKVLYITEPACGYFQCIVTWKKGSKVAVNWLGPPPGQVSVQLYSQDGGPSYNVVDSIASISQEGYCNSGAGYGVVQPGTECGRIEFMVPAGWEERANYTIVVQSLSDSSLIGYTDDITLESAAKSDADSVPSGPKISLLTIPAPTSTNWNAAKDYPGKLPAPTAMTGRPSSGIVEPSSAPSASRRSSSAVGSSEPPSSTPRSRDSTLPAPSTSLSLTSAVSAGGLVASSSAVVARPTSGAGRIAGTLSISATLLAVLLAGVHLA